MGIPRHIGKKKVWKNLTEGVSEQSRATVLTPDTILPASKESSLKPDPLLAQLTFIDWRTVNVLQDERAVGALRQLVKECHAVVLEFLLDLVMDRIMEDYRLWSLRHKARDMKDLGDYIYG